MDTFGKIEKLCKEHSMTLTDLSNGLGIRRSVFTELKMGRTKQLSVPTLEKIAAYFDVPVSFLLEEDSDNPADGTKQKRMLIYELTEKASEQDLDALLTLIQNLTRQGNDNAK